MDTILVVCYSHTGVTRRLAELLCARHGWPLAQVHDKHPRAGASGDLRCVVDSLLLRRPAIRYEGPDPGDFRTVVLMAPVWVHRLAGPMRTFVHGWRKSLHRVAVVTTMSSSGDDGAFREVARITRSTPVRVEAFRSQEVEDGSCTTRLNEFADALQPGSAQSRVIHMPAWQRSRVPA